MNEGSPACTDESSPENWLNLGEQPFQVWKGSTLRSSSRDPTVKQQHRSTNTVWRQWLRGFRVTALHDGPLPSATHWASWKCLPWPSSSCSDLAGPYHVLLFVHLWVDRTVLLWQTGVRRWKNVWTSLPRLSPSKVHYRALSSHPDSHLHLLHQRHLLPKRQIMATLTCGQVWRVEERSLAW